MNWSMAVAAGLVNWLVTTIIVEGEVFAPLRDLVDRRLHPKLGYLVHCHLCAGTWVGFGMGVLVPGPFKLGPLTWALNGFFFKAIGHAILEVTALAKNTNRVLARMLDSE